MGIEKEEENDRKETIYLQRLDLVRAKARRVGESTIVLDSIKSVRLLKPRKKKLNKI